MIVEITFQMFQAFLFHLRLTESEVMLFMGVVRLPVSQFLRIYPQLIQMPLVTAPIYQLFIIQHVLHQLKYSLEIIFTNLN